LLWLLEAQGSAFAASQLLAAWPNGVDERLRAISLSAGPFRDSQVIEKMNLAFGEAGYDRIQSRLPWSWPIDQRDPESRQQNQAELFPLLAFRARRVTPSEFDVVLDYELYGDILHFGFLPIRKHPDWDVYLGHKDTRWTPFPEIAKFVASPSLFTFVQVLERVENVDVFNTLRRICYFLPWPIGSMLILSDDAAGFRALAKRVSSGDFGNELNWLAAEKEVRERRIGEKDFAILTNHMTLGA
jgi:hypothetical protein